MIDSFVNDYLAQFLEGVKNFHWCSLSYLCKSWHKHTKYRFILDLVSKGLSLDLKELLFENINSFHPLSGKKTEIVSNEIIKLLQNKVIVCSIPQNNEFLSHIFTRNKKDTKKKTIFILNKFNKFINWKKTPCIYNVMNLIKLNVHMVSIDLESTLFSMPIHKDYQRYL